jgi:hypothetical protein
MFNFPEIRMLKSCVVWLGHQEPGHAAVGKKVGQGTHGAKAADLGGTPQYQADAQRPP